MPYIPLKENLPGITGLLDWGRFCWIRGIYRRRIDIRRCEETRAWVLSPIGSNLCVMRKENYIQRLFVFVLVLLALQARAQGDGTQVTSDKKLAKLVAKVNEDSIKLVKYQGMVSQFEKDKREPAELAQQSADDNKRAADRLADNPQDKKLARRAHSAAKAAKSDSQKARVAGDKLDDLNADIKKLTRQLGKEQGKLATYQAGRVPAVSGQ